MVALVLGLVTLAHSDARAHDRVRIGEHGQWLVGGSARLQIDNSVWRTQPAPPLALRSRKSIEAIIEPRLVYMLSDGVGIGGSLLLGYAHHDLGPADLELSEERTTDHSIGLAALTLLRLTVADPVLWLPTLSVSVVHIERTRQLQSSSPFPRFDFVPLRNLGAAQEGPRRISPCVYRCRWDRSWARPRSWESARCSGCDTRSRAPCAPRARRRCCRSAPSPRLRSSSERASGHPAYAASRVRRSITNPARLGRRRRRRPPRRRLDRV